MSRDGVDPLLRLFADRADRRGVEVEITLQVGGLLVCGRLTSLAAYTELLDAQLEEAARLDPRFERDGDDGEEPPDGVSPAAAGGFIHLRDTVISSPGYGAVVHSSAWRGRLASVDAFSLGIPERLRPQPELEYGH